MVDVETVAVAVQQGQVIVGELPGLGRFEAERLLLVEALQLALEHQDVVGALLCLGAVDGLHACSLSLAGGADSP